MNLLAFLIYIITLILSFIFFGWKLFLIVFLLDLSIAIQFKDVHEGFNKLKEYFKKY